MCSAVSGADDQSDAVDDCNVVALSGGGAESTATADGTGGIVDVIGAVGIHNMTLEESASPFGPPIIDEKNVFVAVSLLQSVTTVLSTADEDDEGGRDSVDCTIRLGAFSLASSTRCWCCCNAVCVA